jgi:hypothetical protein
LGPTATPIVTIDLSENNLSDLSTRPLADLIQGSKTLQSLSLKDNMIGPCHPIRFLSRFFYRDALSPEPIKQTVPGDPCAGDGASPRSDLRACVHGFTFATFLSARSAPAHRSRVPSARQDRLEPRSSPTACAVRAHALSASM